MAKSNDLKGEVKKLQKEITVLSNKLKVTEKKAKESEKNWNKKYHSKEKEIAASYQLGYESGISEYERKEVARKKALHAAELSFEKSYRKKTTKGRVKVTKPIAKAKAHPKTKKTGKIAAISSIKRRGRPPKQKSEFSQGIEERQFNYDETSSSLGQES
jgi:hypothetical protein